MAAVPDPRFRADPRPHAAAARRRRTEPLGSRRGCGAPGSSITGSDEAPREGADRRAAPDSWARICVDRFLAEGAEVLVLDNFVTGARENVAHLAGNPRFRLIEQDVVRAGHGDGTSWTGCCTSPRRPVRWTTSGCRSRRCWSARSAPFGCSTWPRRMARGSCSRPRRRCTAIPQEHPAAGDLLGQCESDRAPERL